MAGQDLSLSLLIRADGTAAVTGLRQVEGAVKSVGSAGEAASIPLQNLTNALLSTGVGAEILSRLGAQLGDLAKQADDWNNLQARIKLTTDSTASYGQAMDDVMAISQRAGTQVLATGDLYATLAKALKSAGDQTTSVAGLTEVISQAMQISGRSAEENSAAVRQLSQALSSGVLRGDEFNSIMENAPRLQQALADSLGVTSGQLRRMAESGMLTAETVISGLSGQSAKIEAEFSQLPETIARATTRLHNEFAKLVGTFDDATGASEQVASAISGIAGHLDQIAGIAAAGGLAAVAASASKAAISVGEYAAASRLAAENAQVAAALEADAALVSAESAANRARIAAQLAAQNAEVAESARLAAIASENSARQQLADMSELSIWGERRAAAERQLEAAILARAEADAKASGASAVALGAQRAAATAAQNLATIQTQAAVSTTLWGQASAGLRSALGLLKDPMNALMAAMSAMLAYDMGGELRKWSLNMGYAAEEGTLLARSFDLIATAAERSSRAVEDNQAKVKDRLAGISQDTGVLVKSMQDFNRAVDQGVIVFDEASGKWQRGAASIDSLYSALGKLTALYKTQLGVLEQVGAQAEKQATLDERRAALETKRAQAFGTEISGLRAVVAERQKDLDIRQRLLLMSEGELAKSQEILAQAEEEIKQLKGPLPEARAKEIQALRDTVAEKGRLVVAAKLGIEEQKLEIDQARLAAATYGDQSGKLTQLTAEKERLSGVVQRLRAEVEQGEAAERKLADAQQRAKETAEAYSEAALSGAENVQELGEKHQAATAEVQRLQDAMVTGKGATDALSEASTQLAVAKTRVADALRDTQERLKSESEAIADQVAASNTLIEIKGIELQRRQAVAEAMGDEQAAASLNIQSMRLELQEIQNNAEAQRARADLALKAADARKQELEASGKYEGALKAETEAQFRAAEALGLEADKLAASAKAKQTEISISAELVDAQNAVNAVVAEYAQVSQEAADAAKAAGDAAIEAGQNQYEAAEAAKQAAESVKASADKQAAAQEAGTGYANQLSLALNTLYDKYDSLGDSAYRAWLQSADALKQMSTAWQNGTIDTELASVEEHLRGIGIAQSNLDSLISKLQSGAFTANDLAQAEREASAGARQLGEERLQTLRDSIEDAKQRIQDLKQETEDALKSWQDKLDEINGNELAIAERQRIADLADLQNRLNAAVAAGNEEAAANLRAAIATAEEYWSKYIAGMKAADDVAKTTNLPGVTDNGNGTISGSLPTVNTGGGGTGTGTTTGALGTTATPSATQAGATTIKGTYKLDLTAGSQAASVLIEEDQLSSVLSVLETAQRSSLRR